jgi:CheY-like chemotaxis protein
MIAEPPDVFLSHFRHDLRTPVNAVLGYADLLLDEEDGILPADLQTGLANLRDLGHELLAAINGFHPTGESSSEDVRSVVSLARVALRPPTERVVERAGRLAARAEADGLAAVALDIARIRAAGEALQTILGRVDEPGPGRISSSPSIPAAINTDQPAPEINPPTHVGHVLVVDDDPANRNLFARGLYKQGHSFTLAPDGATALDLIQSLSFDAVLLDMLMPGMSGLEVLTYIKRDPRVAHLPVIVVSALDQLEGVAQCLEAGAEDYLPKPCNAVLLKARLGACLEKKRLRDKELEYLRHAETVTAAAAALETGTYDPKALTAVAARQDALGALARVFGRMACEVQAREDRLRREVLQLRVEIDQTRKAREVAEIAESDYFKELQDKVHTLRGRRRADDSGGVGA